MATRYALKRADGLFVAAILRWAPPAPTIGPPHLSVAWVADRDFALTWPSATEAMLSAASDGIEATFAPVLR